MSKMVVNTTRKPFVTIDATPAAPAHRHPSGMQTFVPTILQRFLPALPDSRRPLNAETVQRILTKAIKNSQNAYGYRSALFGVSAPQIVMWGTLPDGTTVAIVEDQHTGIRYMWSLDNEAFEPVSYGMVDA